MISFQNLDRDFKFIVLEVSRQLKDTVKYLSKPVPSLLEKINSRDDHIDNFKSKIDDHCFSAVMNHARKPVSKKEVDRARAINIIGGNLERIGDYCINIVNQIQYLANDDLLKELEVRHVFKIIITAVNQIEEALFCRNISLAMEISTAEQTLDDIYKNRLDRIIEDIRAGKQIESRITLLFIFSYLERMGDALLNIGEAIIFTVLGQKLKIHQYKALEQSLASTDIRTSMENISFESIWGTRSGCSIGEVKDFKGNEKAKHVIFKKGNNRKIALEKDNIELWEKFIPGLPPKILSFQKDVRHSSMLVEHLGNTTLQKIVLSGSEDLLQESFLMLQETLQRIWTLTRKDSPVNAGFCRQISKRINDVKEAHPGLKMPAVDIAGKTVSLFEDLVKLVEPADRSLSAPFSVLIHGDFNIDNIIFNKNNGGIHFIDLHRSKLSDYVQDVSVFMVSNFRLPFFRKSVEKRLNRTIKRCYGFAKEFALKNGDTTFDARLALGVARSLFTSIRFELSSKFAEMMFLKSVHLMEKLITHNPERFDRFVFPEKVLRRSQPHSRQ